MNKSFLFGALVGVGGVWAWHRWVKPMPTQSTR